MTPHGQRREQASARHITVQREWLFPLQADRRLRGPDSFTYQASDGLAGSNIATVKITVQ